MEMNSKNESIINSEMAYMINENICKQMKACDEALTEMNHGLNYAIDEVNFVVKETKTKLNSLIEIGRHKVSRGLTIIKKCQQVLLMMKAEDLDCAEMHTVVSLLKDTIIQNLYIVHESIGQAEYMDSESQRLNTTMRDLLASIRHIHSSVKN